MKFISEKDLIAVLGVIGVIAICWIFSPLLEAIAYAVLLYYLSRPVVRFIEGKIGRITAALLVLLTLILSILAIFIFISIQSFNELSSLAPDSLVASFVSASKSLSTFLSTHPEFNPIIASLSSQMDKFMQSLANQIISILFRMFNLLITIVMSFVIAFFMLIDDGKFRQFVERLLPKQVRRELSRIDKNLYGIYVGSLLSALIVGLITGFTFFLFGLPYPVISGILAAVLQFIPMVGPQLFLIPGAFVAFVYKAYLQTIVLLALAVFLFFVPDNVIKPIILGKTTGIHPLLVLLSFIGGVVVFGPAGFVIGPAVLAISDGLIHAWID